MDLVTGEGERRGGVGDEGKIDEGKNNYEERLNERKEERKKKTWLQSRFKLEVGGGVCCKAWWPEGSRGPET